MTTDSTATPRGRPPTPEQQSALARAVKAGREARAALEAGGMTPTARRTARRTIDEADVARSKMVESNMGLVYDYVNALGISRTKGVLEDLEQEGAIGLLRAVDRFDPDLGYAFSTYAMWWIKDAVTSYLHDHSATIRLPVGVRRDRAKLLRAMENGQGFDDACASTQIAETRARFVLEVPSTVGFSAVVDGEETEFEPVSTDEDFTETVGIQTNADLGERLELAMSRLLDPEEIELLRERFGLDGGGYRTVTDVADELGKPRVTVRAAEVRALAKLRHPAVYRLVGDFGTGLDE